ncbi:hypothetical protein [Paraliomyxa miuraensis]|uniref:hypothetical protein n=1 Tax=Paraliomyxa miuraensis TaxID=376150 RepID=UPI0022565081|nr:hypothetical protein [Paraliomyxa miuraensis]MCX4240959.1 hypothetical protein [Paraliomyxa miuraensis]
MPLAILTLVATALGGCVIPKTVGEGEGSTSSDGPGDGDASTGTTGPGGSTVADTGSTGTSTGAGTGTSTGPGTTADDTGTTGDPGMVCDPPPEALEISGDLRLVDDFFGNVIVDGPCDVTTLEQVDGQLRLVLQCGATAIEHEVSSFDGTLPFGEGQTVQVRAEHEIPIDGAHDVFLAISGPDGNLIYGYWSWYGLAPRNHHIDWYAPIDLELVHDVCVPEPYEPPPDDTGSSFIVEPCGIQVERKAIDVQVGDGQSQRLYDEEHALVDGYDVWVASAKQLHYVAVLPECFEGQVDVARVLMIDSP